MGSGGICHYCKKSDCTCFDTKSVVKPALKNCPFCGGIGQHIHQRWLNRNYYGVQCDGDCVTFFDCRAKDEIQAAKEWNSRVGDIDAKQPTDNGAEVSPECGRCGDSMVPTTYEGKIISWYCGDCWGDWDNESTVETEQPLESAAADDNFSSAPSKKGTVSK